MIFYQYSIIRTLQYPQQEQSLSHSARGGLKQQATILLAAVMTAANKHWSITGSFKEKVLSYSKHLDNNVRAKTI